MEDVVSKCAEKEVDVRKSQKEKTMEDMTKSRLFDAGTDTTQHQVMLEREERARECDRDWLALKTYFQIQDPFKRVKEIREVSGKWRV